MRQRDRGHAASWARRLGVVLVVLTLVAGAVAGGLWWRGDLDRILGGDVAPSAVAVAAPDGLELPPARTAVPVLDRPDGPRLLPGRVARLLRPLVSDPRFGRRVDVAVHDLTHDVPVVEAGADPYMPASILKLLTSAAALEALGPTHRFETTVTLSAPARGSVPTVTLVGGGDPMLVARAEPDDYPRPAQLRTLVAATAAALAEQGVRRVQVGFDASLFTGPAISPTWEPGYVPDVTTPVSALWVDEGIDPATSQRSTDPAALAARLFADGLRARGVRVTGLLDGAPPAGPASEVAGVLSPPLEQVVERVLGLSDNESSEVLLRHVGLATGRPASFRGGAAGAREVLTRLGVPWAGVRMADGSGLSRANRLPLEALVEVLRLGADEDRPDLRAVVGGLPVAGFDGTLLSRFYAPGTSEALGLVRAKTGTLTGTHALAGTVVSADGVLLAFVAVANGVAVRNTLYARDQLDRITAVLAACGCS